MAKKAKQAKTQKEQTIQELKLALDTARDELATARLEKNIGKLKNLRSIFHKRKEIARILTYMKQKEVKTA